jgi:hypothetical protein
MKNRIIPSIGHLLVAVGGMLISASLHAQSGGLYTLNWNTRDGGGGMCSGGVTPAGGTKFSLSGTVGQPDAGAGGGGTLTLQGGFMSAFTAVTLPPLQVTPSGGALLVRWPDTCQPIVLESAPTPQGSSWTTLGAGTLVGSERFYVPAPSTPVRFFRLRKDCPR